MRHPGFTAWPGLDEFHSLTRPFLTSLTTSDLLSCAWATSKPSGAPLFLGMSTVNTCGRLRTTWLPPGRKPFRMERTSPRSPFTATTMSSSLIFKWSATAWLYLLAAPPVTMTTGLPCATSPIAGSRSRPMSSSCCIGRWICSVPKGLAEETCGSSMPATRFSAVSWCSMKPSGQVQARQACNIPADASARPKQRASASAAGPRPPRA
mmetsp:Transcript_56480/g.145432  ORF Transcript_56480/g.145432 Transcript_56480/m.145432 type:complete len:208 (+) Transcript_56480:181-804(+)